MQAFSVRAPDRNLVLWDLAHRPTAWVTTQTPLLGLALRLLETLGNGEEFAAADGLVGFDL
jgi:hypothetical protein